jgi:hypothetical protein
MKILLACLMCLVLGASECFAIGGGPVFGGGGQVTVTGTYAGVFVPIVDPTIGIPENSLVLFTLTIPKVGLATGTTAVFRNGFFYPGTIQGSADPDSARLTGVVNAFFQETVATSGNTTFMFEYDANGRFVNTKITANSNTFSTASTRIRGKATITYRNDAGDPMGDSGGPIEYKVHGFKQSS